MTIPKSYLVDEATVNAALKKMWADDSVAGYEPGAVFGMIYDGRDWMVQEDSLGIDEAMEWARAAEGYGEHVGLFVVPEIS